MSRDFSPLEQSSNRRRAVHRGLLASTMCFYMLVSGFTGCSVSFGDDDDTGTTLSGEPYEAHCQCLQTCTLDGDPSDCGGFSLSSRQYGGDWCLNGYGLSDTGILTGIATACVARATRDEEREIGSFWATGQTYTCAVVGTPIPPAATELDTCPTSIYGLTSTALLSDSTGLSTETQEPGYSNGSIATGNVIPSASTVTIYYDGAPTSVVPSGFASLRSGYCPSGACPISVEGLRISIPTFAINGSTVTGATLSSLGGWDGAKFADETYAMYGTSTMMLRAAIDGVPHSEIARSQDEINGLIRLVATALPAPLTGTGRYATVSGLFTVDAHISVEVSLLILFTYGAPTPAVATLIQPPCGGGASPCGGVTYNASASRTWEGGTSLRYRWVDSLGRTVSAGTQLHSGDVANVPGSPSPWPVRLVLTDTTYVGRGPYGWFSVTKVGSAPLPQAGVRYSGEFGAEEFGTALARGYFNLDSYEDVVVGSPNDWEPSTGVSGGSVQVVHGGRPDVRTGMDTLWTLPGATAADRFGQAVSAGDFNGDGRQDIAAAATGRFAGGGAVYIRYGSATGMLSAPPAGAAAEIRGSLAPGWLTGGAGFGSALATGDVNGDGADDLIVGMPNYNAARGAIWVYYGKPGVGIVTGTGAVKAPHRFRLADFATTYELTNRRFGGALSAADYDADGYADVAIGGAGLSTGVVAVLFGGATGLASTKNVVLSGTGRMGSALTSGDYNGDGYADVAAGAPDNSSVWVNGGAIVVYRGSAGVPGTPETYRQAPADPGGAGCRTGYANDRFGSSLATTRFDSDSRDDLVVGAISSQNASWDQYFVLRTGVVSPAGVLFHTPNELCLTRSGFSPPDSVTPLGTAVTTADITHDGVRDVVVGSPLFATSGRVDVRPVDGITGALLTSYNFTQPLMAY